MPDLIILVVTLTFFLAITSHEQERLREIERTKRVRRALEEFSEAVSVLSKLMQQYGHTVEETLAGIARLSWVIRFEDESPIDPEENWADSQEVIFD